MSFRIIKDEHIDAFVGDKDGLFNHDLHIRGDLVVDGDITFGGNETINGSLTVTDCIVSTGTPSVVTSTVPVPLAGAPLGTIPNGSSLTYNEMTYTAVSFGPWYVNDLSAVPTEKSPLDSPGERVVTCGFREPYSTSSISGTLSPFDTNQSVLYIQPSNPLLAYTFDLLVRNSSENGFDYISIQKVSPGEASFEPADLFTTTGPGPASTNPYLNYTLNISLEPGEYLIVNFNKDTNSYEGVDNCYLYLRNLVSSTPDIPGCMSTGNLTATGDVSVAGIFRNLQVEMDHFILPPDDEIFNRFNLLSGTPVKYMEVVQDVTIDVITSTTATPAPATQTLTVAPFVLTLIANGNVRFPTSGTVSIMTTVGLQSVAYTSKTGTTQLNCSGIASGPYTVNAGSSVALVVVPGTDPLPGFVYGYGNATTTTVGSNGSLPNPIAATINVANAASFPAGPGFIAIDYGNLTWGVLYTLKIGNAFTGCIGVPGSSGVIPTGARVVDQSRIADGGIATSYNNLQAVPARYNGTKQDLLLMTQAPDSISQFNRCISYLTQRGFPVSQPDIPPQFGIPAGGQLGLNDVYVILDREGGAFNTNGQSGQLPYLSFQFVYPTGTDRATYNIPTYVDMIAISTDNSFYNLSQYVADQTLYENGKMYPVRIPITTDIVEHQNTDISCYYDDIRQRINVHVNAPSGLLIGTSMWNEPTLGYLTNNPLLPIPIIPVPQVPGAFFNQNKLTEFEGTFALVRRSQSNTLVPASFNQSNFLQFKIYNTGTVIQSGTTVTGTGTNFTIAMVGGNFKAGSGRNFSITGFTNSTTITVSTSFTSVNGLPEPYAIYYRSEPPKPEAIIQISDTVKVTNIYTQNVTPNTISPTFDTTFTTSLPLRTATPTIIAPYQLGPLPQNVIHVLNSLTVKAGSAYVQTENNKTELINFTGVSNASANIAAASNGVLLPQSTVFANATTLSSTTSITGFPAGPDVGFINPNHGGVYPMTYTSTSGISATITNASGSGVTVTYTAANTFVPGQVVNIVGVNPAAYNLANMTIVTASPTQFTVTNAAVGVYVSGGVVRANTFAFLGCAYPGGFAANSRLFVGTTSISRRTLEGCSGGTGNLIPFGQVTLNPMQNGMFAGAICPILNGNNRAYDIYNFPGVLNAFDTNIDPILQPQTSTTIYSGDNPVTRLFEKSSQPSSMNMFDFPGWAAVVFTFSANASQILNGNVAFTYPENVAALPALATPPTSDLLQGVMQHEMVHTSQFSGGYSTWINNESMAVGIELDPVASKNSFLSFRATVFSDISRRLSRGLVSVMDLSANRYTNYGAGTFWRYIATQFDSNNQIQRLIGDILTSETAGPMLLASNAPAPLYYFWCSNRAGGNQSLDAALSRLYSKTLADVFTDYAISMTMIRNNTAIPSKWRHNYPYWMFSSTFSGISQLQVIGGTSSTWWSTMNTNTVDANLIAGIDIVQTTAVENFYRKLVPSSFTASISGTTLTMTAGTTTPYVGSFITGAGVAPNTIITGLIQDNGLTSVYSVNNSQTVASTAISVTGFTTNFPGSQFFTDMTYFIFEISGAIAATNINITVHSGNWRFKVSQFTTDATSLGTFVESAPAGGTINQSGAGVVAPINMAPFVTQVGKIYLTGVNTTQSSYPGAGGLEAFYGNVAISGSLTITQV